MHVTDALTQVVVPGHAELSLQRGRTYTVFLEEETTVDGKIYSTTQSIAGLTCHVTSAGNHSAITMSKPSANTSYELNGRSGHSVLEFSIPENGKYVFACDYGGKTNGPETVVAVGSGVGEAIVRTVFVSLAEIFSGGAAGVAVILLILFMREREKRKPAHLGQGQV
jgi:hypothetical protein